MGGSEKFNLNWIFISLKNLAFFLIFFSDNHCSSERWCTKSSRFLLSLLISWRGYMQSKFCFNLRIKNHLLKTQPAIRDRLPSSCLNIFEKTWGKENLFATIINFFCVIFWWYFSKVTFSNIFNFHIYICPCPDKRIRKIMG